jgi:hypothetical protein
MYGDGDRDVHADTHPTAYALTMVSYMMIIGLLGYIARLTELAVYAHRRPLIDICRRTVRG